MTKSERAKIEEEVLEQNNPQRRIAKSDIDLISRLDRIRGLKGKKIRVYANAPSSVFVPKDRPGKILIDYIERSFDEKGKKIFTVSKASAKRSSGQGACVTVDGRPYEDY